MPAAPSHSSSIGMTVRPSSHRSRTPHRQCTVSNAGVRPRSAPPSLTVVCSHPHATRQDAPRASPSPFRSRETASNCPAPHRQRRSLVARRWAPPFGGPPTSVFCERGCPGPDTRSPPRSQKTAPITIRRASDRDASALPHTTLPLCTPLLCPRTSRAPTPQPARQRKGCRTRSWHVACRPTRGRSERGGHAGA